MTTGIIIFCDNEDIEVVDSFSLLESIINEKDSSSQEIQHSLKLGRVAINGLEKIFQNTNVSLQRFGLFKLCFFSVTLYGCQKLTFEEAGQEEH